ncbi:hypothetical protein [Citrobacter koseri]|uniref:hypothetical protein n=1 Tax=Citrobacter koseri TaxID=545 RepID=UPI001F2E7BFF|nr:hypothetical protein [Citrobacter koseri]
MDGNIIELVKSGHELAKELHCAESAALISDLASQLDVQFARSNALAAKLNMINGLMDAAEQANKLAQEATEKLVQERDALAAERDIVNADNAYLRDQVICWARECDRITFTHTNKITDAHQTEAEQELANTTPATSAFLAEVRAQGVEMLAKKFRNDREALDPEIFAFGEVSEHFNKAAIAADKFAAQLRKGAAQ